MLSWCCRLVASWHTGRPVLPPVGESAHRSARAATWWRVGAPVGPCCHLVSCLIVRVSLPRRRQADEDAAPPADAQQREQGGGELPLPTHLPGAARERRRHHAGTRPTSPAHPRTVRLVKTPSVDFAVQNNFFCFFFSDDTLVLLLLIYTGMYTSIHQLIRH